MATCITSLEVIGFKNDYVITDSPLGRLPPRSITWNGRQNGMLLSSKHQAIWFLALFVIPLFHHERMSKW